jgi:hypothetical protein
MHRFTTNPIQLESRLDHAIAEAHKCQEMSSPTLPVATFSWRAAHEKLNEAKDEWKKLQSDGILKEEIAPYTMSGTGIVTDVFKPTSGHDVSGMHAFCTKQKSHLSAVKSDPLRSKLGAHAKKAVVAAETEATARLVTCDSSEQMLVAIADEAAADVAFARKVLATLKMEAKDKDKEKAHLEDLIKNPREHAVITAKSYIAKVGLDVGPLQGAAYNPAALRVAALKTDQFFNENPQTPAHGFLPTSYRFLSERKLDWSCHGEEVVGLKSTEIYTDTGTEPNAVGPMAPNTQVIPGEPPAVPVLHAPPAVIFLHHDPSRNFDGSYSMRWKVRARPAPAANFLGLEPVGFRGTHVWIWHDVTTTVSCKGGVASVESSIAGSHFPSHKVWTVHSKHGSSAAPAERMRVVYQDVYSALWVPHPTEAELVR